MNKTWHKKNVLGQNAPLAKRIAWHLAHQKNCACRPVSRTVTLAIKGKHPKTCSRGHIYIGNFCGVCWPGGLKRHVKNKKM